MSDNDLAALVVLFVCTMVVGLAKVLGDVIGKDGDDETL